MNAEKNKSYTVKQVADKLKNMLKVYKDKVDNNNRTGSKRMLISVDEEAAFGASSSTRPEFLLNSNGPGQTYRDDLQNQEEVDGRNSGSEEMEVHENDRNVEPVQKKKKKTNRCTRTKPSKNG